MDLPVVRERIEGRKRLRQFSKKWWEAGTQNTWS